MALQWMKIGTYESDPPVYVAYDNRGMWIMNGDELEATLIPLGLMKDLIHIAVECLNTPLPMPGG